MQAVPQGFVLAFLIFRATVETFAVGEQKLACESIGTRIWAIFRTSNPGMVVAATNAERAESLLREA